MAAPCPFLVACFAVVAVAGSAPGAEGPRTWGTVVGSSSPVLLSDRAVAEHSLA